MYPTIATLTELKLLNTSQPSSPPRQKYDPIHTSHTTTQDEKQSASLEPYGRKQASENLRDNHDEDSLTTPSKSGRSGANPLDRSIANTAIPASPRAHDPNIGHNSHVEGLGQLFNIHGAPGTGS